MRGPLAFLVVLAIAYVFVTLVLGIAWMTATGIVLIAAVVLLFKGFTGMAESLPAPSKKTAKIAGVALLGVTVLMYGLFGLPTIIPFTWEGLLSGVTGAAMLTQPRQVDSQTLMTECRVGLTEDMLDEKASVMQNAYDIEATAGYGTAVDLSTSCYYYSNGNQPADFVTLSSDTSDNADTDVWNVGDAIFAYCGGTSYYTDPVEGLCVRNANFPLVLKSHGIVTRTNLAIVGFDKNMNALTAAGNTSTANYDLTLGANEEEIIYLELTQDSANKAYNLGGVAVLGFNDIKYIRPVAGQGFTKQSVIPNFLYDVALSDDADTVKSNITGNDFELYTLDQPVLLKEWESVTYKFLVTAGSTDPSATDNVWTTLDGGVVCFLDSTYVRGADGVIYLDVHNHAEEGSETDAGLVNDYAFPVGKQDCVVIEGN